MRALWKGNLSFGLVSIPVQMYSASKSVQIDLDMLHAKDQGKIRYARICTLDGEEVPYDEVVKGYQVNEGEFVVLTDEDFEKAHAQKATTIDIHQFTEREEIDPIYADKPYFLEPQKGGEKAYALLREALRTTKKVAIATYVLRRREHIGILEVLKEGIILNQLRYKDELRDIKELNLPKAKFSKKEIDAAVDLIEKLAGHFDPKEYHDEYVRVLERIIAAKKKGVRMSGPRRRVTTKKIDASEIFDLLRKSLNETKREHRTAALR